MSERPYKCDTWPGMIPYITVADASRSISFYKEAFGFELGDKPMEQDGKILHAEMTFLDTRIMFCPEGAFGVESKTPNNSSQKCPMGLYVYCKDVKDHYEKAIAAGATSISAPEDMFWGDRMCRIEDPDGYIWSFAQNVGDHDPSKMKDC